jgi:hypothetical protein
MVMLAQGRRQVMEHGSGGLVGWPSGGFESPQGITRTNHSTRLTLTLTEIVDRPVQVSLGMLGDGSERLSVDGKPARPGQGECHGRHRLVMAGKAIAMLGVFVGAGLQEEWQTPADRRADQFRTRTVALIAPCHSPLIHRLTHPGPTGRLG